MCLPFNSRLPLPRNTRTVTAFTLIELLVSMTFLVILMLVVTQVIGIVQRTWVRTNSRVSQFREARTAFDVLGRTVGQATLNTYWMNEFDELSPDSLGQTRSKAKNYVRQSELQFVCGPTVSLLTQASGNSTNYPGHAVFFQAPLGVTKLVPSTATSMTEASTENLVNLMCGRGYFVEWGTDAAFRPAFLDTLDTVPLRSRMRLMEFSPTAEMNKIYAEPNRPLVDNAKGINNGKKWFNNDVLSSENLVVTGETVAKRAFTRPVAENILVLIISPQNEKPVNTTGGQPLYAIAPNYAWDSTLKTQPGGTGGGAGSQGTQHLLPPQLKITMVALDQASGEFLAREENSEMRDTVLGELAGKFTSASEFQSDLNGESEEQLGGLEALLVSNNLSYRIFTTTIALKQSRWSL